MYFVVIMAFALVLTDELPLGWFEERVGPGTTLLIAAGQVAIVALVAFLSGRRTLARLDSTEKGFDQSTGTFSHWQHVLLGVLAAGTVALHVMTPWPQMVRVDWQIGGTSLGELPLVGDLLTLLPFFVSLIVMWVVLYPAELRIRKAGLNLAEGHAAPLPPRPQNDATAALAAAKRGKKSGHGHIGTYLLDKFRHQVFIIAGPMTLIVLAKHFADMLRPGPVPGSTWPLFERLPWLADSVLGTAAVIILGISPLLLRYIWSTEPLPEGPLRDRFTKTCDRIGLKYREILLWHTHGMSINAAVMGFVAPLRYVLISDALLETMREDEIEAVFGHEAGHVQHWHLPYFILFALVSMYLSGGTILLFAGVVKDDVALLQLIALAVLLMFWLFGFGWLSRRFERQADVYGVRCVTPDIETCVPHCPVHGETKSSGLCISAANLFGRTLLKISELNGIPRDAPSWRHGSIESRCQVIEQIMLSPTMLRKFDRRLILVKIGLIVASIIGTAITVWLYYPFVARALKSLGYWPFSNG